MYNILKSNTVCESTILNETSNMTHRNIIFDGYRIGFIWS